MASIRSTNNFTLTPLQANRIYIGTWDNVLQYLTAQVTCTASTNCEITSYQSIDKLTQVENTYQVTAGSTFSLNLQLQYQYLYFTVRNLGVNQTQLNFDVIYRSVVVGSGVGSDVNISATNGNAIVSTSGKLQVQDSIAEASLISIDAKLTTSRGAQILWATASTGAGGFSASADLSGKSVLNLTFYGNSNLATVFTVQFSNNGTTWYSSQYTYTLTSAGDWGFSIPASPFYVRLTSSANVSCNAILNYS
jgi:hypothetical protein